ncbi:MAG: Verru_Chthon cassette protein D [Chthoniobacteraceae bacterium]
MNRTFHPAARRPGFTLVELLAVIAVIAVIMVFVVPAANQIIRGSQLTQASQLVADQLGFARQLALSRNRTVDFRFYRFGDPETPGEVIDMPAKGQWRGVQVFELIENGAAVPAGPFHRLPRMTALSPSDEATQEDRRYSTLLDEELRGPFIDATQEPTAPEIPVEINGRKVAKNYQWLTIRFLPDGSTNLPAKAKKGTDGAAAEDKSDTWYVTVMNLSDIEQKKDIKDVNYATVQLDPFTGAQKTFRPNVGAKPKAAN